MPRMGCAVTLRGQMWYLGGFHSQMNEYKRQVSLKAICTKIIKKIFILKKYKIVGCEMIRQSDMPIEFAEGSCNLFEVPEEKALLCFSRDSGKRCHL